MASEADHISVSSFLQQALRDRDLETLPQKQLWQKLRLTQRSPESYRKIFFEGHVPGNLSDLDEIAAALNISAVRLKAIAYVQQAPEELKSYLAGLFSEEKFPW